jgi:hypothetical protein
LNAYDLCDPDEKMEMVPCHATLRDETG